MIGASYAHYSGRYTSSIFGRNTPVANAGRVTSVYNGPAGQGYDFAPAYDLANYSIVVGIVPDREHLPGRRSRVAADARVHAVGGADARRKGAVRAMYVWRKATGLVESFIDDPTAAGKTTVVAERHDVRHVRQRLLPQLATTRCATTRRSSCWATTRLRSNWSVAGHWTVQLKNEGNYEGEAANAAGLRLGARRLSGDCSSRAATSRWAASTTTSSTRCALWSTYQLSLGRFGALDITPMWRYNSALTYSLVANSVPLSAVQRARNPGYARLPGSGTNGRRRCSSASAAARSSRATASSISASTYQVPVWTTLKPWVKLEVLNVLNNDKLIAWDTTITVDPASALDADGLPTGYLQGARFGQGTSTAQLSASAPGPDRRPHVPRRLRLALLTRVQEKSTGGLLFNFLFDSCYE